MIRLTMQLDLRGASERDLAKRLLNDGLALSSRERQIVALLTPYTVEELSVGLRPCEWDENGVPTKVENMPDGEYETMESIGDMPFSPNTD